MKTISADEFAKRVQEDNPFILDVRDPDEFLTKFIPNSKILPLDELRSRINEIPKDQTVYLLCQCGNRSAKAISELEALGYSNVINVEDGIEGYEKRGGATQSKRKGFTLARQAQITYGFLTLLGIILASFVHSKIIWFSTGIAAGLLVAGLTGFCLITAILIRMPWNKDYRT